LAKANAGYLRIIVAFLFVIVTFQNNRCGYTDSDKIKRRDTANRTLPSTLFHIRGLIIVNYSCTMFCLHHHQVAAWNIQQNARGNTYIRDFKQWNNCLSRIS